MRAPAKPPEWDDMQGLVLSAYSHLALAQYLLFRINDVERTRVWLQTLVNERVTRAIRPHRYNATGGEEQNVNVAFTASGLARLAGIKNIPAWPLDKVADEMKDFPYPFLEGMGYGEHRARILGSLGCSAPQYWRWGGPTKDQIDILVCVFVNGDDDALRREVLRVMPPPDAATIVGDLPIASAPLEDRREHFGFVDGMSQPILVGSAEAERFPDSRHLTAVGEIVCGYPDGAGITTASPSLGALKDFARNGTYLVLMQLYQNVAAFREATLDAARQSAPSCPEALAVEIREKIVGRHMDGTPLVPYATRDDNEFGFAEDPYGFGCPLGAHIRRTNPRDAFLNNNVPPDAAVTQNRHRILRRGRKYGPRLEDAATADDGHDRGLFFMCLNADIERQFEFIQQNWINNPSFVGLGDERDPLVGGKGDTVGCPFTIPMLPAPMRVATLKPFVRIDGGAYFFLPGYTALRELAGAKRS